MAVATGAKFKLYAMEETTEGVAPTGNWGQLPCMSFELAGQQSLTQDQVLSSASGRDAGLPFLDGVQTVAGDAKVPIDSVHFGRWLKMLMGTAVESGSGPYTHVFTSGALTISSYSFEKAFPNIGAFYHDLGARAGGFTITTAPTGASEATINLMALQEPPATSATIAGTPVVTPYRRFMAPSGSVKRNGTALAGITGGSITFSNNIDAAIALRSDNRVEAMDYGQATGGGSLTLRFSGTEGVDADAFAATPSSVEYDLVLDANTSLSFLYPQCWFKPVGPAIQGPGAITRDFSFIAGNDGTAPGLLVVTLRNGVAGY